MRFALMLMLAPGLAVAEELPFFETLETRYGILSTVPTEVEWGEAEQLILNGAAVEGVLDKYVDIRALVPRPDGDAGDWALVSMSGGGNGCPMMWTFVNITPEQVQATEPFGTCSEAVMNARVTDNGSLELDMPGWLPEQELVTYTYDGYAVSEMIVLRSNDGAVAAGAGMEVTRWIGQHPVAPFADPAERVRFGMWMTEEEVYELAERVEVGSVAYEAEGWVIGDGFDPKAGGDIAGMWAVRIRDGAVLALFRDTGQSPRSFGDPTLAWPQAMTDFAKGP
ncbi:MAG: hypothetical protein ACRC6I_05895 [Paracoccaceae bacterium]